MSDEVRDKMLGAYLGEAVRTGKIGDLGAVKEFAADVMALQEIIKDYKKQHKVPKERLLAILIWLTETLRQNIREHEAGIRKPEEPEEGEN